MCEQNDTINRGVNYEWKPDKILELKNRKTKLKILWEGLNTRLDQAEDRINQLKTELLKLQK